MFQQENKPENVDVPARPYAKIGDYPVDGAHLLRVKRSGFPKRLVIQEVIKLENVGASLGAGDCGRMAAPDKAVPQMYKQSARTELGVQPHK